MDTGPLAQNGASLAPIRASGAHPSLKETSSLFCTFVYHFDPSIPDWRLFCSKAEISAGAINNIRIQELFTLCAEETFAQV